MQIRRHIQVHIQHIPMVEIDGVAMLGVIFHSRAGAAEEGMLMRAVELRIAAPGGLEVGERAAVRILGGEDAVEQSSPSGFTKGSSIFASSAAGSSGDAEEGEGPGTSRARGQQLPITISFENISYR